MKCITCGKNAQSEYCFLHKPKKPLSSGKGLNKKSFFSKPKEEDIINVLKKSIESDKLKKFFELCWKNKTHYSEISGKFLGNEIKTIYLHHILPKSKYPEACFDEENIILLTFEEHQQVESDIYRYEEINNRRKKLLIKYNLHYD
jgi:hypothetical protein